jgi:hypothetical protein
MQLPDFRMIPPPGWLSDRPGHVSNTSIAQSRGAINILERPQSIMPQTASPGIC